MNTEQLRAEFEAWAQDKTELYKMSNGEYSSRITRFAFEAYQAGRAAQASGQDREDAERYRWLRDNAALQWHFTSQTEGVNAWAVMKRYRGRISSYNGHDLDDAIDAARAAAKEQQ